MPDDIQIDVTGYDVGDSIHISNVTLPKGSESAITDRDFTIATIVAPSAMKSSEGDTTVDGGEEAAAEGEEEAQAFRNAPHLAGGAFPKDPGKAVTVKYGR